MTKKGSDHITITILKTTVRKLRAKKGTARWDELLRRLADRGSGCGIECMRCKRWTETANTDTTSRMLAERNGWTEIAVKGRLNAIGFVCPDCISSLEQEEER